MITTPTLEKGLKLFKAYTCGEVYKYLALIISLVNLDLILKLDNGIHSTSLHFLKLSIKILGMTKLSWFYGGKNRDLNQ